MPPAGSNIPPPSPSPGRRERCPACWSMTCPIAAGARATAIGDGHIDVVSGWQGDLEDKPGVQLIDLPSAPVTGPATVRFMDMPAGTTTMPVKGGPQGDLWRTHLRGGDGRWRKALYRRLRRPAQRAEGSAQERLGLCRLQQHAIPRQAGPDQALRQGRLQSGAGLYPGLHRQKSEGFRHRPCRHPRSGRVPAL